jgi:hypothetical protein
VVAKFKFGRLRKAQIERESFLIFLPAISFVLGYAGHGFFASTSPSQISSWFLLQLILLTGRKVLALRYSHHATDWFYALVAASAFEPAPVLK